MDWREVRLERGPGTVFLSGATIVLCAENSSNSFFYLVEKLAGSQRCEQNLQVSCGSDNVKAIICVRKLRRGNLLTDIV